MIPIVRIDVEKLTKSTTPAERYRFYREKHLSTLSTIDAESFVARQIAVRQFFRVPSRRRSFRSPVFTLFSPSIKFLFGRLAPWNRFISFISGLPCLSRRLLFALNRLNKFHYFIFGRQRRRLIFI